MNAQCRHFAIATLLITLAACAAPGTTPLHDNSGALLDASSVTVVSVATKLSYSDAPYADVTLHPRFNMSVSGRQTGTQTYAAAFVTSYQNRCVPAWGGAWTPSNHGEESYFQKELRALRREGGDIIISFGGEAGVELAEACSDAPSTAAAYEAFIDRYQVNHIDFDIEGAAVSDTTSVMRRSQALKLLQDHYAAAGKTIRVSYTLPVLPNGLPSAELNVIEAALSAGVKLELVNVMAMDYGDSIAPHPAGKMGRYAIDAASATARQLVKMKFPVGTNAFASVGVTPMIGQNDVESEVFSLQDAQQVVTWAKEHHLGRVAFWSATRDKACAAGQGPWADPTCSGLSQKPGAFQKIFAAYQ